MLVVATIIIHSYLIHLYLCCLAAATKSDYKICKTILNSEDEFIYSISKWNQAIKSPKKLNHVQVEAMRLAVQNSFQLIQGPPGG